MAPLGQHEIKGLAMFIDCPIEVTPLRLTLKYVSSIRHDRPAGDFMRLAASAGTSGAYFTTRRFSVT